MKAPNPIQGTRKGFQKNNLEAWIRRMRVHLKIKKKEYEDIMCYNNVLDKTRRSTRSIHKVQKKKDAYIALWHFPPILLKEFGSSIPRTIPIQKAKDLQLYSSGGGLFYSKADVIEDDTGNQHVLLVPAFVDTASIRTDLLQVPEARDSHYALMDANASISPVKKRSTPAAVFAGDNNSTSSGDTNPPAPKRRKKVNTQQMDETELRDFIESLQYSHDEEIAGKVMMKKLQAKMLSWRKEQKIFMPYKKRCVHKKK